MKTTQKSILMVLMAMAIVTGCKKDEPNPVEDNENLTTVRLKFTEGGTTSTFTFKDLDGAGGNAPIIDKISLKPNTNYTLAVEILDESKTPAGNITNDIFDERDQHIFQYVATPATVLSVTSTDKDTRGFPVGLTATARTVGAGTGKLKVVLHHQPPVNGKAIKDGTFGVGSVDFDGTFDVDVK
jgi:hypothetical protein